MGAVAGPSVARLRSAVASADLAVARSVARGGASAAALVVVHRGRALLVRTYGMAQPGRVVRPQVDQFQIASITKTFMGVTAARLIDRGTLRSIDDEADRYLRRLRLGPQFGRAVTIRHLITHSAGFDSYVGGLIAPGQRRIPADGALVQRRLPPIIRAPGSAIVYNNYGFPVLGALIEDVTDEPLDRYIRRDLLDPLGMTGSVLSYASDGGPRVVRGMRTGRAPSLEPAVFNAPWAAPSGSMQVTAPDMARYMLAVLGHRPDVLSPRVVDRLRQPLVRNADGLPAFGHAFMLDHWAGLSTMSHGGAIGSFFSQMMLVPDADLGVFAITAGGPGDGSATEPLSSFAVVNGILTAALGEPRARGGDLTRADPSITGSYWIAARSHTTPELIYSARRVMDVRVDPAGRVFFSQGGGEARARVIGPRVFDVAEESGPPIRYVATGNQLRLDMAYGERVSGLSDPRNVLLAAMVLTGIVLTGFASLFSRSRAMIIAGSTCAAAALVVVVVLFAPAASGRNLEAELWTGTTWRFDVLSVVVVSLLFGGAVALFSAFSRRKRQPIAATHLGLVGAASLGLAAIGASANLLS